MPSRDYEEFIAAFNAHGVRYLVIGAHAVAFHARPRATKALDLLIDPTAANVRKALRRGSESPAASRRIDRSRLGRRTDSRLTLRSGRTVQSP